nr:OF10715 [Phoebe bournei]
MGRVRKIMKLDKDINRVNSEAVFLISHSTDLFLHFLTEKSMQVALDKKRKTIKTDHLRIAAKRHPPTADFLLDSLSMPSQPRVRPSSAQTKPPSLHGEENPLPPSVRRIDHFFHNAAGYVKVGSFWIRYSPGDFCYCHMDCFWILLEK